MVRGTELPSATHSSFLDPVYVKQAFAEEPSAVFLREGIEVTQRGNHQIAARARNCDMVRQTTGFAAGFVTFERQDRALLAPPFGPRPLPSRATSRSSRQSINPLSA